MPRAALAKAFVRLASTRTPATAPLGALASLAASEPLGVSCSERVPSDHASRVRQRSRPQRSRPPPLGVLEVGIEAGEHAVMRGHGHGLGGRRDRREDKRR